MMITRLSADRITSCCRGFLHYAPLCSPRGSRGPINRIPDESQDESSFSVESPGGVSQKDSYSDISSKRSLLHENVKGDAQINYNIAKHANSQPKRETFRSPPDTELPQNVEFPSDVDSSKYKTPNDWARDQVGNLVY